MQVLRKSIYTEPNALPERLNNTAPTAVGADTII